MSVSPLARIRSILLASAALGVALACSALIGCSRVQPDFGGAVVVPEPGTSPSIGGPAGDPSLEPSE